MTCFDRYIVVDWSANARPKRGKNSIWIASVSAASDELELENAPTRTDAMAWLVEHLEADRSRDQRVLLGFDAAFGYPTGFAAALGLGIREPWREVWRELSALITDDEENANNRFDVGGVLNARLGTSDGPFWGNGLQRDIPGLPRTKPSFPWTSLAELRATELVTTSAVATPKSVWQLSGVGTVGGQTLTLIPVLEALRSHVDIGLLVRVWPFETGFLKAPCADGQIVLAEVWPSALPREQIAAVDHRVLDARQVTALALHFQQLDQSGALADWFEMRGLDAETKHRAVTAEGWILWSD